MSPPRYTYLCTACFMSPSRLYLVSFKTMLFAQPTRDINKTNAGSHTTHTSEAHAHTGAHACTWPSRCCRRGTRVSLASQAGVQTSRAGRCCSWQGRVSEGCWRGVWADTVEQPASLPEQLKKHREALFTGRGGSPRLKETRL